MELGSLEEYYIQTSVCLRRRSNYSSASLSFCGQNHPQNDMDHCAVLTAGTSLASCPHIRYFFKKKDTAKPIAAP